MEDYITKLWFLGGESNIDSTKTKIRIEGTTTVIDLYKSKYISNCPRCSSANVYIKGSKTFLIKHVNANRIYGEINFHSRTYKCSECTYKFQEKIDSLNISNGKTRYFINAILFELKNYKNTYQDVAEKYKLSKTTVENIFDLNIDIRRKKFEEIISIDEIYSEKLTDTKYCCIIYNPASGNMYDVIDSRRKDALSDYFARISEEEKNRVKYVTMDLWNTYKELAYKNCVVSADPFHVIENLNRSFNEIRIRVMKKFEEDKDNLNSDYWIFKKHYKLLLKRIDNIKRDTFYIKKLEMTLSKEALIENMLKIDSGLREAYYLKEEYQNFNAFYSENDDIKEKLEELIDLFLEAECDEMKSFGILINRWKREILNSFKRINGWRLTNANMERVNQDIGMLYRTAFGYSNFPRARNRIMYCFSSSISGFLNHNKKDNNSRIINK